MTRVEEDRCVGCEIRRRKRRGGKLEEMNSSVREVMQEEEDG